MTGTRHTTSGVSSETDGPRRESVSHKNPDVVLIGKVKRREEKKKTILCAKCYLLNRPYKT